MLYEDATEMFMLYSISPELTCTCDELHICQQCYEEAHIAKSENKECSSN